jgi:hypothetical protein
MEMIILTEEEKIYAMEAVKKGEYDKLGKFIIAFDLYILKIHNKIFNEKNNKLDEELRQECHLKILQSIKKLKGDEVGQLINFTLQVINNFIKREFKKHKKYNNYNIQLNNSEDIHYYTKAVNGDNSVEETVINRIIDLQTFRIFIKGNLTKGQEKAIAIYMLYGEMAKHHLTKYNIEHENYRKSLQRAKFKIHTILSSEEVRKFRCTTIIFIGILLKAFLDIDFTSSDFI